MPKGTGPLTARKKLQESPNTVAMLHSLHLRVLVPDVLIHQARFQPPLPTAINAGMKTETVLHSQIPSKQAQVHFSKVTAFKSLSVDRNTVSRLMLSTSTQ